MTGNPSQARCERYRPGMDRGGEKHPHRGFVLYRGHQYRNQRFTCLVGEDYGGGKQKERRRGREREIKEEREGVRGRGREGERGRKRDD